VEGGGGLPNREEEDGNGEEGDGVEGKEELSCEGVVEQEWCVCVADWLSGEGVGSREQGSAL
jgi:hypothetical protein